ncbi:MAG: hypothetical protein C0196_06950, partial [Dictyoglomus turgidum]
LYMKIFYFVYDPLQGFGALSWQYPDSGSIRIDLSNYPYSYNLVPTGNINIISGLSLWIE